MRHLKTYESYEDKIEHFLKNIRPYEDYDYKEICKIPTKSPEYEICKWKIGAVCSNLYKDSKDEDFILIHYIECFDGGKTNDENWTWSGVGSSNYEGIKFQDLPEYKGKVEITEEDRERYYAEKEAEKYNL